MTRKPPPPADHDDNPPRDAAFFAAAHPAAQEAALVGAATAAETPDQRQFRAILAHIVAAHEAGTPMDRALDEAKALYAAE